MKTDDVKQTWSDKRDREGKVHEPRILELDESKWWTASVFQVNKRNFPELVEQILDVLRPYIRRQIAHVDPAIRPAVRHPPYLPPKHAKITKKTQTNRQAQRNVKYGAQAENTTTTGNNKNDASFRPFSGSLGKMNQWGSRIGERFAPRGRKRLMTRADRLNRFISGKIKLKNIKKQTEKVDQYVL